MSATDLHDTRPGGPNRQERAHRAGVPEPLTEAIEELGMVQVPTCVSVHCDQCGDALGDPGFEAHYPTEDAALDAAAAGGWRVGPGGRLWCSACGPVLTCEADGHEFTPWRPVLINERQELLSHPDQTAALADGQPVSREYRDCRRCCLHESRPGEWLIGALSGPGKNYEIRMRLLAAAAEAGGGGVMSEHLGPLDREPVSVHAPFVSYPGGGYRHESFEVRRAALLAALEGVALGVYDEHLVAGWRRGM